MSWKEGPVKLVNHTSWVTVVTITDRPKLVCNRCVIDLFVALFVLSLCPVDISAGVWAFVIGLSQVSSFFSYYRTLPFTQLWDVSVVLTFTTGVACRQVTPWTPGPVPLGTCICCTCWGQSCSQTCRYFTGLCTSNIPRTFSILIFTGFIVLWKTYPVRDYKP